MSDGTPPPQPPGDGAAPGPGDGGSTGGGETSTGIDANVSGLLTYILAPITGILFYVLEKKHREVRYHAAHSTLFGLAGWIASVVLSVIPFIGWILAPLIGLGFFILWIVLLIKGYNLEHFKLPVIGDMAEEWADKGLETA